MPHNTVIRNQRGANTNTIQPQAGSPNNAVQQVDISSFTLTAGESISIAGLFTWYEVYLAVNDTVSIRPYPAGNAVPSPKGITITLDVPSFSLYLVNTGVATETFSIIYGGGATPARDQRLIPVPGATVIISGSVNLVAPVSTLDPTGIPTVAQVTPLGANAFSVAASGVLVAASAGKTIVLRTLTIAVNGAASVFVQTATGSVYVLSGIAGAGVSYSYNLPFPVQTAVGDHLVVTGTGVGSFSVSGSYDYV